MERKDLEDLLGLILNEAEFRDLDVISAALERRRRDLNSLGRGGLNPETMAKTMSRAIREQLEKSKGQVEEMTRRFVEDLIRQQEPNIPEEDLQALLAEWVPSSADRAARKPAPAPNLPPEVLLSMVRDFLDYSVGAMSATKQVELRDQLGSDWVETLWKSFPSRVQKLVTVFLKGKLEGDVFWDEVKATLDGRRD